MSATQDKPLFKRLLVANRGEIALRVMRTAREMGIETVAVFSDADRKALHVRKADYAVNIGPPAPGASYLRGDKIIEVAKEMGCDAVHPGYGFLSENAGFAEECTKAGIEFIGPPPNAIRLMGDKVEARKAAEKAGVPLVPGLQEETGEDVLAQKAAEIGYPVMLKAAAGGGGKGIRIIREEKELAQSYKLARSEAESAFGDGRVYLEKFVLEPRHVEVQVMCDKHGGAVAYGERECSVQRRHQKVVEESPCVALTPEMRRDMEKASCELAKSVGYVGAGTVEYLYSRGEFYFLEMNTRLQVEHPITEVRFGVDLVKEQLRVAAGGHVEAPPEPHGHSIEVRINAEDPVTYYPSLGTLTRLNTPGGPGVRLDASMYRGMEVTPHYDSMIGKLIVHGTDRPTAIQRLKRALKELRTVGFQTTAPLALRVLDDERFLSGKYDTSILEDIDMEPTDEQVRLASLVGALFRNHEAENRSTSAASGGEKERTPRWALVDRMERLRR